MVKRLLPTLLLLAAFTFTVTPAQAHDRPTTLRVATYNIHAGAGSDNVFDVDRTAEAIASLDASVISLQEVDVHWHSRSQWRDLATELATTLDMHIFFGPIYSLDPTTPGAPRREFGNAILSSYPIVDAKNHEITRLSTQVPNPVPEPMPGFPEVEIDVNGTPVHVYSTHLDYRPDPAVRQAQVADMRRIMRCDHGEPQLLLGDFNAPPEAPELRPLWRKLSDVWAKSGQPDPGYTYPASAPDRRIDYIAASKRFKVKSAATPTTLASDHLPVVAELTLR
ncbi:endonuclease/exonuclease/phosphatase family protein [Stackebrandtia nassauensis]|uniref:endonuclease/exonuclease/phosphatase family protein n=1 Tax=Stackebrandtia nassauensis TaxID=283811 RepID=UPI00059F2E03